MCCSYKTIPDIPDDVILERRRLVSRNFKGKFWKPCPGTGCGYYCCGYQVLSPVLGCGMYCSYCILQEYHKDQCQVLFENISDLEHEVHFGLKNLKGVVRFGTGEFADSLYLERELGVSCKIASLLQPYRNVLVEFKTKSSDIEPLEKIEDPSKVIIGFSMNTKRMIDALENGTASLKERLSAAKRCEEMGFLISFHFDPMIWYKQWKDEYTEVVDLIFSTINNPARIAWWSLGGFRTMQSLKSRLKDYKRHLPLFSGEIVLGRDKKYRYFRPLRVEFYKTMQEQVEKYYPEITLYLCMESPEVWKESGMIKRIPNGLVRYLDERAEVMLDLQEGK